MKTVMYTNNAIYYVRVCVQKLPVLINFFFSICSRIFLFFIAVKPIVYIIYGKYYINK